MFTFVYTGNVSHSYGYAGLKVAEALPAGHRLLDLLPAASQVESGAEWGTLDGVPARWVVQGTAVALLLPEWLPHLVADRLVIWTMFEGKGLPKARVRLINEYADLCLVPSRWCMEGFLESGVTVPMRVVPLGVDPVDFPFMERELPQRAQRTQRAPYRFLWNGFYDGRKGHDRVYGAFWQAFHGSTEAELVLHFREYQPKEPPYVDPNVRVIGGYQSLPILQRMLAEADCYVFPSRGEGWGLPPREAAATGLPVIATDYGGLAEEIENWALPLRACKETKTTFVGSEDERFAVAEICLRDLTTLMRWCFDHREDAAEMGRRASEWIRANGTWAHVAEKLIAEVNGC